MRPLNAMQQSVLGNDEPIQEYNTILVPTTGYGKAQVTTRLPMLGEVPYIKAPKTLDMAIRLKSLNGVLPAKGITHHVMRQPPPDSSGGMQAPQGIARGQRRGLAYGMDWEPHDIRVSAPVLSRSSSVFRLMDSQLGKGRLSTTRKDLELGLKL